MLNAKPDPINPPGPDTLPPSIGYAIPILTLFIVLLGFTYYLHLIQKGRLTLSETFVWILFTLFMFSISFYLLILQIMSTFDFNGFNLFSYLASFFGLVDKDKNIPSWLVLIIMIFLAFLYAKAFHTTIKISKMNVSIGNLSREVAILNGKLDDTLREREISNKNTEKVKNDDK